MTNVIADIYKEIKYSHGDYGMYITIDGKRERALYYEGDFAYTERGRWVVEDVKGVVTDVFRLKRRLFIERYPAIELRVIPAKEV